MSPLPAWQLIALLIVLLVLGHFVAWWLWRGLAGLGRRLAPYLPRRAGPHDEQSYAGRRWPRTYSWLVNRFALDRFVGVPLTMIVLLLIYLAFLFGGLVEELFEESEINQFDRRINAFARLLRDDLFLEIFGFITAFGDVASLTAVVLVTIGFLWAHRRAHYIPGLLLTIAGSQAITWIGKYAIMRDRPEFLTFASAISPSFPSAHATGAMAVYGFIVYAVARDLSGTRQRFELAYWGSALIALIAASRVILSVHYASDVVAGLIIGAFWLLSGFALTEYLREHR